MAVKYFDNGYLALDNEVVVKLTDISLSYNVDADEVTSYDSSFEKEFQPTYKGWTASATMIVSDDSSEPTRYSSFTGLTGTSLNAYEILELVKAKQVMRLVMMIDTTNFQYGSVFITSFELSASIGSKMTAALSFQGSGSLTKGTAHPS